MDKELFRKVNRLADELITQVEEWCRKVHLLRSTKDLTLTVIEGKVSLHLTSEGVILKNEDINWHELTLEKRIEVSKALPAIEKNLDTQLKGLYESLSSILSPQKPSGSKPS